MTITNIEIYNKLDLVINKIDIINKQLEIKNWVQREYVNYVQFRKLLKQTTQFLQCDIHEIINDLNTSPQDKIKSVNEITHDYTESIIHFLDNNFLIVRKKNEEVHMIFEKLELILEKMSVNERISKCYNDICDLKEQIRGFETMSI
ncbi:MAG: hypothetical protein EBU90_11805 [Proteobacteria bacterium]|nr:hypothetical protein [Pseudomonadota bacterium]NBP14498.1 hypothetical protein [bacterium]